MKLTDLQKEVSPVWEEKGYEVLKYDREAVKQTTKEAPTWVHLEQEIFSVRSRLKFFSVC